MRSRTLIIQRQGFDRVDGLLVVTLIGSLFAIFLV
jgi:hypothetical protein